jgi:peptide/nickel transport system substrate-binding protein
MKADPKLKVLTLPDLGYMGITVNVGKGEPAKAAFANLKIRQALAAAIDRKAINDVVFNGEALPGNQWINPTNAYYQTKYPVPDRNLAKAKALMQEAGVKTPLAIDFMVPNNPETRQAAEVIQAMAAEAGFDMKIRVTEFATSLKEAEDGRYQAYMLNWSGRADPDGNIYIFHKTGGPQNYGGYSDPEADALLDEGRTKNDPAERKAIYEKLAGKLLSEGSIIYIYHRPVIIAYNTKVSGYRQLPDGLIRLQGVAMK